MKWVCKKHYRKQARMNYRAAKFEWHSAWAWTPKLIPEVHHQNICIPAHYVWWDWVDRKRNTNFHFVLAFLEYESTYWIFRAHTFDPPNLLRLQNPPAIAF